MKLENNIKTNKNKVLALFPKTFSATMAIDPPLCRIEITKAPKQGFSSPDQSWFKGESIDFVKRILFNKHSRIYNIMDRSVIEEMVCQHMEGKQNRRLLIWSLLNVDYFLKEFDVFT